VTNLHENLSELSISRICVPEARVQCQERNDKDGRWTSGGLARGADAWTQGDVGSDWERSDLGQKGGRRESNVGDLRVAKSFIVKPGSEANERSGAIVRKIFRSHALSV